MLMKDVAACEKLRGGGKQPLIRRCPNGETWSDVESDRNPRRLGARVPAEVKHLSKQRKRKKHQSLVLGSSPQGESPGLNDCDSLSSGERKGTSLNLSCGFPH